MLIHIYHAMSLLHYAVTLKIRFQSDLVGEWQGHGMACVNQTLSHCVNEMGTTGPKSLATRQGYGMGRVN
jgi:hypothetical protein